MITSRNKSLNFFVNLGGHHFVHYTTMYEVGFFSLLGGKKNTFGSSAAKKK